MPVNQMIAVWGSTGSGKTTTALKLAKMLADRKQNVMLVLCDDETPSLPLLLPNATEKEPSLGELLEMQTLSQIKIFQHCVPVGEYMSLLGYRLEENELSYPEYNEEYSKKKAKDLFYWLRRSADYVVTDCSSHLTSNVLTAVALEYASVVLKIVNADLKSLIYVETHKPLLQEARFHYDQQINVVNNLYPAQDVGPFRESLGMISCVLPNIPALKEQYDSGKLMEHLLGRDARKYEPVLNKLIEEVILNEPEREPIPEQTDGA